MTALHPRIEPATVADVLRIADIESRTFATGPLNGLIFGPPRPEAVRARADVLAKELDSMAATMRIQKAVITQGEQGGDDEDQIVGFALWRLYRDPRPLEHWQDKEVWEGMASLEGANEFFGNMSRMRDRYINGKSYLFLHILVVLPEFHGRGVGSALLKDGLATANEASLPTWLESSERGYRVYRKFGFEDVDEFDIDRAKYGGEGKTKTVCMLRPVGTKLVN
ncbi:acetyltransferase [Phlyctema vagabunda]|uniref:Acetyltransferase n=1 Tax=Phlyctema vagabunda TaxID=108571 RepID=A0ABR4P5S5_9HELO